MTPGGSCKACGEWARTHIGEFGWRCERCYRKLRATHAGAMFRTGKMPCDFCGITKAIKTTSDSRYWCGECGDGRPRRKRGRKPEPFSGMNRKQRRAEKAKARREGRPA